MLISSITNTVNPRIVELVDSESPEIKIWSVFFLLGDKYWNIPQICVVNLFVITRERGPKRMCFLIYFFFLIDNQVVRSSPNPIISIDNAEVTICFEFVKFNS
jgi:hypothetical protein